MKTFIDSASRTWTILLTINAVKRVRDLLGINLLEPEAGDPPLLTRLGTDEILLCDVIYCLVKPQADEKGVTDEEFGAALGGQAILAAQKAFYEELIDFFHQRGREDRVKAVTTQQKVIDLAVQRAGAKIDGVDIEKELDKAFGATSTNSPDELESTPAS